MKPDLIKKFDEEGYIELDENQIRKYITYDRISNELYFKYNLTKEESENTHMKYITFSFFEVVDYKKNQRKVRRLFYTSTINENVRVSKKYYYSIILRCYFSEDNFNLLGYDYPHLERVALQRIVSEFSDSARNYLKKK